MKHSQLRRESRQLILRPDLFPGRESGLESHVLEGDHGPRPRETEAPAASSLPASSLLSAVSPRRQHLPPAPLPPRGRGVSTGSASCSGPTEGWGRGSRAGTGGPIFSFFLESRALSLKSAPNCPDGSPHSLGDKWTKGSLKSRAYLTQGI